MTTASGWSFTNRMAWGVVLGSERSNRSMPSIFMPFPSVAFFTALIQLSPYESLTASMEIVFTPCFSMWPTIAATKTSSLGTVLNTHLRLPSCGLVIWLVDP